MAVNYFEPGSAIYILKDVPLDITYNHTWYFSTPQEQLDHFRRQTLVKQIGGTQYQRYDNTAINVQVPMSKLYGANYMYFVNDVVVDSGVDIGVDISGRRLKYFYAFITDVEYVNPNTSRIYYEIDYMQSFMFDYVLGNSFVVREHSKTDNIGDNLVAEDFTVNADVIKSTDISYRSFISTDPYQWGEPKIMVIFDASLWDEITAVGKLKGLFVGSDGTTYDVSFLDYDINIVKTFKGIGDYTGRKIVGAYVVPKWVYLMCEELFGADEGGNSNNKEEIRNLIWNEYSNDLTKNFFTVSKAFNNIDGYIPKNNKLYTHPFNYYSITGNDGKNIDFKYEQTNLSKFGQDTIINFEKGFCISGNKPILFLVIKGYENQDLALTHTIEKTNLPCLSLQPEQLISFVLSTTVNSIAGLVGGGIGASLTSWNVAPNIAQGASSFIKNLPTNLGLSSDKQSGLQGSQISSSSGYYETKEFTCYCKQIHDYQAKIIDEFFTMYGYATNKVKTPNRNVRSRFTYTQTNGCVFKKINLPQKFANKIASIYDKGITFWKPTATIGDYNSPNNVL